jgi:hypothetical protein
LAAGCELRTLDGLPLPSTIEGDAASNTLRIRGAPPGCAVLLAGAGHVVLDLAADTTASATLVLHDPIASEVRVQLFDGWSWKLPAAIPARLRILAEGDVVVSDTRFPIEHGADGWTTVAIDTPPGEYRILFEAGDLRRVDEVVHAGFVTILRY